MEKNESKKPLKKRGRPAKSKGLGDTIEKITKATGIKKLVELFSEVTGIDCGCKDRKDKLNNLFPYNRPTECMNKEQFEGWKELRLIPKSDKSKYIAKVMPYLRINHATLFNHKSVKPCNCPSGARQYDNWRKDMEKIYNVYQEELTQD